MADTTVNWYIAKKDYDALKQQRDDLLAELEKLAHHQCANHYMKEAIREAIAKAGGA